MVGGVVGVVGVVVVTTLYQKGGVTTLLPIMSVFFPILQGFSAPSHDDKLMEVVAVSGLTSIATAKVLGIQNHRLRQCRFAKVIIVEEMAVQVDGEAWLQKPGTLVLSHKNKARMLVRNKAFSQTLESWKQKHSSMSQLPPVQAPITSTLNQSLTSEELDRYRELAASVPPLVS